MKRAVLLASLATIFWTQSPVFSHCQMPCGIYHDDMVFDQIDQYVETMYKGITILRDSKFETLHEKNEFIRWVMLKDNSSSETASLICTYFLQQKIKPGEEDTQKRLESAHRLLFLLVQIKQNVDRQLIEDFSDEWDKFKVMFHVEGYECKIEMMKLKKRDALEEKLKTEANKKADESEKAPEKKTEPVKGS